MMITQLLGSLPGNGGWGDKAGEAGLRLLQWCRLQVA